MSQDYLDKLIEKDKAGTQIQSIPLHDTELRGITIDDPITVEGNPINFSTKNEQNAIQTVVDLEPIQDLHGYSKPWVGGAGKNLLLMTLNDIKSANPGGTWSGNVYTINGITFTILMDRDSNVTGINVNGTAMYAIYFLVSAGTFTSLLNKSLTLNGCPANGSNNTYQLMYYTYDGSANAQDFGNGVTFIPTINSVVQIVIRQNVTINNLLFKPMLRLSTVSDSTFEPYSNICSILPHEEIKIGGCGKNLIDIDNSISFEKYSGGVRDGFEFFNLKPGTYTISSNSLSSGSTNVYFATKNAQGTWVEKNINITDKSLTFNILDGELQIWVPTSQTIKNIAPDLQLEYSNSLTDYEPYKQSNSLTLPLPEDVYGGTLNLETGELVVTHKIVDLGNLSYTRTTAGSRYRYVTGNQAYIKPAVNNNIPASIYSESFENVAFIYTWNGAKTGIIAISDGGSINICDDRYTDAGIFQYAMSGIKLVYELADSYKYTIHLTPAQLKLFKDVNNLNSSDYTTLTVTYHSNSIATLAPATDTTDGLLSAMDKHKLNTYDIADIGSDDGVTVENNPLMITTRSDQHALSTKVSLAPIQDLHGYSKPWVGGAGKNLIPMTIAEVKAANTTGTWNGKSYSYHGFVATVLTDSDENIIGIKITGTSSTDETFILADMSIKAGSYKYSGCTNGSSSTFLLDFYGIGGSPYKTNSSGDTDFTLDADNSLRCRIFIKSGYAFPSSGVIFYPMLRLATEPNPTFEPYTNICSISGLDEIDILGCGKNLCMTDNWEIGQYNADGIWQAWNPRKTSPFIKIKSNTYYTMSIDESNAGHVAWNNYNYFDKDKNWLGARKQNGDQEFAGDRIHLFNIHDENAVYLRVTIRDLTDAGADISNLNISICNPQIEQSLTATTYEPYKQSNNLSIPSPETVYGGELDLESGELVVDRKIISDMSALTWQRITTNVFKATYSGIKYCGDTETANILCDIYAPGNYQGLPNGTIAVRSTDQFWVRDATSNDDGTTFINIITGHKICYELATPYTLYLTPSQLTLFKDINHISTNAKSISVTYREGKLAINSPATDTKDGLLSAMDKRALDRTEEIVEGNPIQFETESTQVAKSTIVDLKPIQDLHGFTKPWIGGAGKNLCPIDKQNTRDSATFSLNAGSYTFSFYSSGSAKYSTSSIILYDSNNEQIIDVKYGQAGTRKNEQFTLSETTTLYIKQNNINADSDGYFYRDAQIETGDEATSYEPYTNICPISGYDEVDINGCGENLLPLTLENIKLANSSAGTWTGNIYVYNNVTFTIETDANGNVTRIKANGTANNNISLVCGTVYHLGTYIINGSIRGNALTYYMQVVNEAQDTQLLVAYDGDSLPFTTTKPIVLRIRIIKDFVADNVYFYPMIRLATDENATFTPYQQSNNISIQLDDTVYGGKLDVEKGELVVDRLGIDLSECTWTWQSTWEAWYTNITGIKRVTGDIVPNIMSEKYKAQLFGNISQNHYVGIGVSNVSDLVIVNDNSTSEEPSGYIVYELATPTTISLTPKQVKLLQGVNTITTNADNITLTYRNGSVATLNDLESLYAKLKAYIDSLHSS